MKGENIILRIITAPSSTGHTKAFLKEAREALRNEIRKEALMFNLALPIHKPERHNKCIFI